MDKINLLLLGFILYLQATTFGQSTDVHDNLKFIGSTGIGIGQENFVSLPKLSAYVSYNLLNNNDTTSNTLQKCNIYFGAEASMLVFFGGTFSISGTAGLQTGPITLDCPITRLWLSDAEGDIAGRQTTINPKIGGMIGPIWIKAGPSFLLTDDEFVGDIFGNFMRIGDYYMNVEVNYFINW